MRSQDAGGNGGDGRVRQKTCRDERDKTRGEIMRDDKSTRGSNEKMKKKNIDTSQAIYNKSVIFCKFIHF